MTRGGTGRLVALSTTSTHWLTPSVAWIGQMADEVRTGRSYPEAMRCRRVIAALGLAAAVLAGCSADSGSLRAKCEQQWDDNQATLSDGYVSHASYVRNCLQTYKDLGDGLLEP